MELSKIALRINHIYKNFRYGDINAKDGVRDIISILNAIDSTLESEYERKYIAELIKKGIRYVVRMDATSKQTYNFLEENVVDDTLDANARYEIYKILEQNYPKKVKGLREYLLRYVRGFFPENIEFDGEPIINAGLGDFLFKTYRTLSRYGNFSFNQNYKGFTSENCLIVNLKHDAYKSEDFHADFTYGMRDAWIIGRDTHSYYLIGDKYKIGVRDLLFSVNLLRGYVQNYNDNKLSVRFSNDTDTPIRIEYEGSDIKIYFFQ